MRSDSDPANKFPLYPYYDKPNPGAPGKGTWVGHQDQMKAKQRYLKKLLDEWKDGPCGGPGGNIFIPVYAWRMQTMAVPEQPRPVQSDAIRDDGFWVPYIFPLGKALGPIADGLAGIKGILGAKGALVPIFRIPRYAW